MPRPSQRSWGRTWLLGQCRCSGRTYPCRCARRPWRSRRGGRTEVESSMRGVAVDIRVRVATIDDVAAIDEMLGVYEVLHPGRSLKGSAAWRLTEGGSESAVAIDDAGRVLGF